MFLGLFKCLLLQIKIFRSFSKSPICNKITMWTVYQSLRSDRAMIGHAKKCLTRVMLCILIKITVSFNICRIKAKTLFIGILFVICQIGSCRTFVSLLKNSVYFSSWSQDCCFFFIFLIFSDAYFF